MKSVEQLANDIIAREGGFVNDPDDPGGPTNWGVTLGTMKRLGIDLNGDGQVTVADVQALTRDRAVSIFIDHYFHGPGIVSLPQMLQATVFDMYVNSGVNAVRLLQRLLAQMGFDVADDGMIGPLTVGAAHQAVTRAPDHIVDAYGIARRNYYYALADARPASRKYCRRKDGGKGGWITRAEEFISPRYRLTEAQHRARVAKWV